jgi:hypothetical protein
MSSPSSSSSSSYSSPFYEFFFTTFTPTTRVGGKNTVHSIGNTNRFLSFFFVALVVFLFFLRTATTTTTTTTTTANADLGGAASVASAVGFEDTFVLDDSIVKMSESELLSSSSCSLRIDDLLTARVYKKPFEHVYVPGFISKECLREVNRDFPESLNRISSYGGGNIDEGALRKRNEIGGSFEAFLDAMASATLRKAFEQVFQTDLSNTFIRSTIRGVATREDGRIHADDASKIVTALVYLNEEWVHESECGECGKLQLLARRDLRSNSTPANDAYGGNLLAFKNPAAFGKNGGFHGFKKFSPRTDGGCLSQDAGCERKMVQINYQTRVKLFGDDEKKNGRRRQTTGKKKKQQKVVYVRPNDPRVRDGSVELPGGVRVAIV